MDGGGGGRVVRGREGEGGRGGRGVLFSCVPLLQKKEPVCICILSNTNCRIYTNNSRVNIEYVDVVLRYY
jgi:hypothetical protein